MYLYKKAFKSKNIEYYYGQNRENSAFMFLWACTKGSSNEFEYNIGEVRRKTGKVHLRSDAQKLPQENVERLILAAHGVI